jgi:hypothetical protein
VPDEDSKKKEIFNVGLQTNMFNICKLFINYIITCVTVPIIPVVSKSQT